MKLLSTLVEPMGKFGYKRPPKMHLGSAFQGQLKETTLARFPQTLSTNSSFFNKHLNVSTNFKCSKSVSNLPTLFFFLFLTFQFLIIQLSISCNFYQFSNYFKHSTLTASVLVSIFLNNVLGVLITTRPLFSVVCLFK